MDSHDVDFLRAFLKQCPQFADLIRLRPPALKRDGRWKTILSIRNTGSGVLLRVEGGGAVTLSALDRVGSRRFDDRRQLVQAVRRLLPGYRIENMITGTDRTRHQSGAILRLRLSRGTDRLALLWVYPGESTALRDRVLSSLVLWWEQLRRSAPAARALLFIPHNWSERLLASLPYLRIPVECYKFFLPKREGRSSGSPRLHKIYPVPVRRSELTPPYVMYPSNQPIPAALLDACRIAPDLDLCLRHGAWELSCLGLPVAWQRPDSQICYFDRFEPKRLSHEPAEGEDVAAEHSLRLFMEHWEEVKRLRAIPAPDPAHPCFRFAPERWLESLILRNHRAIDPGFSEVIYSQVPSCIENERKVMDLLTATGEGRLAVIEVKVEKDLSVIFQALDYWERVSLHLKRGDFQRCGYFQNLELSLKTPLLYLVCPLFEFHRVLPVLRRQLKSNVRFECVGINTNWKEGVRVLRRFRF